MYDFLLNFSLSKDLDVLEFGVLGGCIETGRPCVVSIYGLRLRVGSKIFRKKLRVFFHCILRILSQHIYQNCNVKLISLQISNFQLT